VRGNRWKRVYTETPTARRALAAWEFLTKKYGTEPIKMWHQATTSYMYGYGSLTSYWHAEIPKHGTVRIDSALIPRKCLS
jgi:hypothetical protein